MKTLVKWVVGIFEGRFIPIRTKFMFSMITTILGFGIINFAISHAFIVKTAREQVEQKTELIAKILEHQITISLQTPDLQSAKSLIEAVKQGDPDILYILVFSPEGQIISSTFEGGQIPGYLSVIRPDRTPEQLFDGTSKVTIRQKFAPIEGGKLGSLLIGFNQASMTNAIRKVSYILTAMILVFLLLGIFGAMAFAHFISTPIYKILKGFDEFVPGGTMPKIEIRLNDEMKLLSQGFQSMMERVDEIDRNYKLSHAKILEMEWLASMGILATGLAHEIDNPIAGIQMCLLRLQKSPHLDERQTEYLFLIAEATEHIKGVVHDLLDYAQQSDCEKVPLDLRDVITDAVKLVQPRLHRGDLHLHLDLPSRACVIHGVKSHLVQVIVNGIINSNDAVGSHGNVWISMVENIESFRIVIEDDGVGLTTETAAKAFEPFFTTKGKKGTGLGLYVSCGIVKYHQGVMELNNKKTGRGAVLAITLPSESTDEHSHSRG